MNKENEIPIGKIIEMTTLPLQKGLLLIVRKIIEIDHYATPEGMAPPC